MLKIWRAAAWNEKYLKMFDHGRLAGDQFVEVEIIIAHGIRKWRNMPTLFIADI